MPNEQDGSNSVSPDARRFAPATARNREPILEVLERVLPATGTVLEIASGTGEHAVFFVERLPGLRWQSSDPDPVNRASISSWIDSTGLLNVPPPLVLDVTGEEWPIERADAVVCINMIHIAPWEATRGLMRGTARLLPPGGTLVLYGPYRRDGLHTAPSNEAFDQSLRARDAAWGVRDLEAVVAEAARQSLWWVETVEMPANNLSVIFRLG